MTVSAAGRKKQHRLSVAAISKNLSGQEGIHQPMPAERGGVRPCVAVRVNQSCVHTCIGFHNKHKRTLVFWITDLAPVTSPCLADPQILSAF